MQKMAMTTHAGMRPVETGIKKQNKRTKQNSTSWNLETLRYAGTGPVRYYISRAYISDENNVRYRAYMSNYSNISTGTYKIDDARRKNIKENIESNFYSTYQHGIHNKYVMLGRSNPKTRWFEKIKSYETVHAKNWSNTQHL
jgi:hypothetical protein